MNNNYDLYLKDKRWYRKRKVIIKRDNNKCTVCGTSKNLQVHHTYYFKIPIKPWLYPNKSMLTVCKSCHEEYHRYNENKYKKNPPIKKYTPIPKEILANLNYYEIEYIPKKGVWAERRLHAETESDALNKLKGKIKEVIRIKQLKNPLVI